MKRENIIKIFPIKKLLYISFIFILISKTKCEISEDEIYILFEPMTLDRIRQIYWNIVIDLNSKIPASSLGQTMQKTYIGETLHSLTRNGTIKDLVDSLHYLNTDDFPYYKDIKLFEKKLNDIDQFTSLDNIITDEMPKNFVINFAINIDKYERTKERKIDGISDYINYMTKDKIIEYILNKIDQHNELKENFKEIVLGDKILNFKDINKYYYNKTLEELIQIIYGFENYLFNVKNRNCSDPTSVYNAKEYNHDEIEDGNLFTAAVLYAAEASISTIDDSLTKIENRNFEYMNNYAIFNNMNATEFQNNILAFEKYYKRQKI